MEDIFIVRVKGLVVVEIGATEILALFLGALYFFYSGVFEAGLWILGTADLSSLDFRHAAR